MLNKNRAQTIPGLALEIQKENVAVPAKSTVNAVLLAEALTKNKAGEKEKFDAIFTWVAANIKYDYRSYYSSGGSGATKIRRMLKYRRGICLDYATLMDTLCTLAGITNVSVYGYAKDEIFDVSDSLYLDNHAWNAVKLGGLWYLYDATWASGSVTYGYTKFSKRLLKLMERFPEKYKQKKIKRRRRYFFMDECGAAYQTPAYSYKQRFLNRLVRKLIGLFPLTVKQDYVQGINPDFYLADPALFSITHFPDNADWSLMPGKTMRDFETDSLYYHLNDSSYTGQNRAGYVCSACDYDLALGALDKKHYLKNRSFMLNSRNHFIAALCEYDIADINYRNGKAAADSVDKISHLDTASFYFQAAINSLKRCSKNIETDYVLQKKKNKNKQAILLKDNKTHTAFVRSKVKATLAQKRNITGLKNRSSGSLERYWNRKFDIERLRSDIFVDKKNRVAEKRIESLNARLKGREQEIDSLNRLIAAYKTQIDSVLDNLSLNVWQKVLHHDSLIIPILKTSSLRKLVKDDYKKSVVELRKQIPVYEFKYANDLESIAYVPAKFVSDLAPLLFKLVDKRYNYEKDSHRLKLLLVKFNRMPLTALAENKAFLQSQRKDDYCWLRSKFPNIKASVDGFESLKKKQTEALEIIIAENDIERDRTYKIDKELLRRKKKYKHVVVHNSHIARVKLSLVKEGRHNYLELLEKQRREEKR